MCGDAERHIHSSSPLPWIPEIPPPNGVVIRDADGHVVADELLVGDAVMICVAVNAFGDLTDACKNLLEDRNARVHLTDRTLEMVKAALDKALGK